MKRWVRCAVVSMFLACGSGHETASNGAVFLGSCTGKPDSTGGYGCQEWWQIPVDGMNQVAIWQSVCQASDGTFATGHCAGGAQPGCCLYPAASDGAILKQCSYAVSDPDGAIRRSCVEGFSGTWSN